MANEKEPLLPIINEKIETNKKDWIFDVEIGPRYEDNKWRWFLVNLLRIFIIFVAAIFTWICCNYVTWNLNIENTVFGYIFVILYFLLVPTPILLLVSFVLGQFNFFYVIACRGFIYKHILSREYILNRIAAESSSSS
ncbi:hypothetical protein BJ944DRAFT_229974 [Cunninghamella echinulata]|nr:hypothetical protein BJ944DRAFT_229974 [Cunninghamella echinulata]